MAFVRVHPTHRTKIMREMGFEIDPSTAGSSVRFDPPNPKDNSITFHKREPGPDRFTSADLTCVLCL